MRDVDLFQQALGLAKPWYVVGSDFDATARRLDLYLDFEAGGTFKCPECGHAGCKAHDTTEKVWRHLNFFQHEAFLHARVPRVRCERCGVKLVDVPWARAGSGFTLMFEAIVLMLVKSMPVRSAAKILGEHDTRLWRVVQHYVEDARARADFSSVRRVGVDETSRRSNHNYITLFVDLDESKLLFATEGKHASTLAAFRADLAEHGGNGDQIEEFCLDMSPAFQRGIADHFPGAGITFDKFHIMSLINKAVEDVRREEQKTRPELKHTRFVWIKNPENLKVHQIETYDRLWLPRLHLRTVRAYHLRLAFQDFWAQPQDQAESFLRQWYGWAVRCRLAPMVKAAHILRDHWEGVLNWFKTRINNGILEGMNSLIQAAKAKARGYRSMRNLIAIAYLIAGKLDLTPLPI